MNFMFHIKLKERIMKISEKAKELCEKFPSVSSKKLSRILREETECSLSAAITAIRRCRGLKTVNKNKFLKNNSVEYKKESRIDFCKLPTPEVSKYKIHELPVHIKKWLVMSDVHIPYHDLKSLELAIDYGKKEKVDGVLLLGDIVDFYQLSSFMKDPLMRRPVEELDDTKEFLAYLREQLNPKEMWYKAGNHEARLEWYLMSKAPELFGLDCITLPELLDFNKYGVTHIPTFDAIRRGHLTLIHGHETGRGLMSPVNPARGLYMKAKACVIAGHEHRSSDHTEKTIMGETITCWSIGCLSTLTPTYRTINNWNHGFAILYGGHEWAVENKRIINGKIV